MASILDEIKAEVEAELSQQPQEEKPVSVLEDVKQKVSAEPQQTPVEEPQGDFFESAERWLEPAPTQKSSGDIFLGLISNKRSNELDDEEKGLFNALSDDEQYKVAQARKDIPLDDAQARRIFEVEKSKMPSVPTFWEDWYNLGGDAFDVVKNVAKLGVKVPLGAAEFGRDAIKASDMTVSDEEFYKNLKKAKSSFYSFMAPAFEIPESVLWAAEKAKEGGFGWADAAGEKLGLVSPEDRFENWKGRRLVSQAQAEYFREHPTIYGRLLDSPLAKDALSYIAKTQMESPEELAKRNDVSIEEARSQQDAMARQQVDQLTSEMESELPEENIRVRTAGEFLLPGEVGMGTMGAVSIGLKGTKSIAQGLKYIGKSADEIAEINKAAQALRKSQFAEMLKKRTERAEAVAQGAGKIEKAIEGWKPAAEKVNKILGNITTPVLGGIAGYSVSDESPVTGILSGVIGGVAARGVLKGTKVGLEIPTFVRELAEARKVAPLGKTFETLGKSAEGSALKAKILSRGGKTIDNILSNSVEYARTGIHGTTLALATGALESADPEEMKQMLADGLAITLGGRALQHIKGKMMGNDPIIEQRERISDDSRIHRRYQEADPETQANLDQISDFDNAITAKQSKLNESESDLANLMVTYKGSAEDAQKIKLAQSEVEKNKIALDQVKRANVQTRNEFGREFLKTYANLQDITNGVMKSGQNNVGFNVLSTDQIYQRLRNDPANSNVPDADLAQMASQAGFYSNPAQQGLAFDRRKPSIVINADSIRERIKLFGESPTEALVHETSHFMDVVPEFQEALAPVRSMLFQNEIRDAAGNIKATTSGIFSKAKLVELFNDGYLRHLDPQGREAFSKLNKLWDESRGQLDENKVANYMKSEVMADLLGEVSSRHLSNDLDSATLAMWDRARIKAKKNLLDRAINRFYGLGGRGDIVTAANTRAEFPPEAMAAARDAMRQIVSLNGEISPPAQEADMPAISKAQMMKNSALIERFGKDSPLFKTEFKVKVFDKDGNQVGESMPVTTPNPREGTFQSTDVGMKKLSGYGDIPAEAQGLQVPEGGTLVVSRDLVMEPDGVTPVMYDAKDAKKIDADRKKLITEALDTDDYGTPNRFEPVAEGSETYRGTFTSAQIQAIKDMPESLVPRTLKEHMLKVNDAIARGDGTRFIVDYAAVMNDKGKYQAFSPKMYDLVPIGMHLSKKGNFLVTTISVGRIFDKMRLWNERMPGRLRFWDNNLERTFDDFSKYLNNWQQGKAGETGLDADPQVALQKKNIFNDLLNLYDKGTEFTNLDRTTIPRKKGDPRNKDANRTIMSIRVDHIAELIANENATKLPVNYGFAKINFMPERMEGDFAETQKPITQTERFPTSERGFYSGLQQTIDQKVQGKFASPDQIKAIVSNPQNVKAEELKWSGVLNEIDRLATENQGKVPKDKVMDYLRNEGAVKFEEVTLGENTEVDKIAQKYGIEIQKEYEETTFIDKDGDEVDFEDLPKELQGALNKNIPPKYEKYQLPGGENYREVVMAMPEKNRGIAESDIEDQAKVDAGRQWESWTPQERSQAMDEVRSRFNRAGEYTSSHFPDIPNYVAHMRLNERTDAEGNEGLFMEELQSDRHQAGREKGYSELSKLPVRVFDKEGNTLKRFKSGIEAEAYIKTNDPQMDRLDYEDDGGKEKGIPDAPFRKDWSLQLFKRALRDAVDSEKEWIGWTTGDTQAERYDLSKQIDRIEYNEDKQGGRLTGEKGREMPIIQTGITPDKLADYIGKETAQKLLAQEKDKNGWRVLENADLKVGGEGMKGFYDQILPKEIGKYVGKMGGKVEKSEIETPKGKPTDYEDFNAYNKAPESKQTPIWKVNITPEMSGAVKGGQLQFMPERPAEQEPTIGEKTEISPKIDADYMKAVDSGDVEAQQKLVDEAARSAGYNLGPLKHGTASKFNEFAFEKLGSNTRQGSGELGFFFTSKDFLAKDYSEIASKGGWGEGRGTLSEPIIYDVFLDIKNPKKYKTATEFYREAETKKSDLNAWRKELEDQGYDGVIVRDDLEEVVVFNPNQIKSADPVTYDEAGNAIPLSQRFNPKTPDIRFMPERPQDDTIKPADLKTSAKPEADAVIKPFSNALISSAGLINFLPAYHGTPYDVDKFKLANIGTGEGAQAYGWGLYFAQARQVGEGYRKSLQPKEVTNIENIESALSQKKQNLAEGGNYFKYDESGKIVAESLYPKLGYEGKQHSPQKRAAIKKEITQLENQLAKLLPQTPPRGNLYKVDLDVKDEDLLDWDKPLSEQSENVREKLVNILPQRSSSEIDRVGSVVTFRGRSGVETITGEIFSNLGKFNTLNDFVNHIKNTVSASDPLIVDPDGKSIYYDISKGDPKKASEALLAAGISGIRYLDGTSRKQGEGTYNYVVFDENLITILDKNDKPVAGELPTKQPLGGIQFMPQRPQDDTIKPADLKTSAKPEADAVIKPFSNALVSSAGLINFLPAYHGTPFDVDKFKLANIGTGEGAQAYGWGLYFAQARKVAQEYKEKLTDWNSPGVYEWKGMSLRSDDYKNPIRHAISLVYHQGINQAKQIGKTLQKDSEKGEPYTVEQGGLEYAKKFNDALNQVKSKKEITFEQGNLYKVDLNVKDEDLLDWDKPLSEQSEKVRTALKKYYGTDNLGALELRSGQSIYTDLGLAQKGNSTEIQKKASEVLNSFGIPGIRYLDGTSRKQGEGTYNYVVFDENLITILDKNDKPVAGELPTKQPLSGIQFMPQRPVGKTEPLPDFETTIIKGVTPRKGFNWKKATNVEFDIGGGKKMSFSYDPEVLTEPVFKDLIKELKGQPVILLEADRQRATGGDMGGPLHPFLKSNQVTITGPDGKKYKAVWANMSSWVISGVKNRLASHGAKYALVHLMDSIAHKSNKRTARTLDKMMRDANLNQREKEIVSLSMQAGIIAGEKAAMGASIGALKRQISQAKGNQEKIQIINEKINKIKQERDDITPKGIYGEIFNIVSGIKKAHSNVKTGLWKESGIEKANKKLENYVKSKEYKELLKNNKSLYISDNIGNTFNNRGSAIESILSFKFGKFDPSYVMRESSDFKEGENLDIVTAVELSQNPDIFALYFGNDPKEEATMSTAERKARDEMRANPDFVEHEAYDWVMLGPEKGNNFLVEKPVKPEEIFKKYRETHAGKSVVEGSDETVVGAMRKNSGFILRVDEDTQAVVASKKKKK